MGPEQKEKYSALVDAEIAKARESLTSIEHARNTADSAMTSRYDTQREIYAQDANVQRTLLERFLNFRKFLSNCAPETEIQPGAVFNAELWDDNETLTDIIYSPIKVLIEGIDIITPESPIGTFLQGKKTDEPFVYQVGKEWKAGIVTSVN